MACVHALARLNDLSSLPWILAATKHNVDSPETAEAFAAVLLNFDGQAAAAEIRRVFAGTPVLAIYEKSVAYRLAHPGGK